MAHGVVKCHISELLKLVFKQITKANKANP